MRRIVIASLYGVENIGGVERVTYYLQDILREKYKVKVFKRIPFNFKKVDFIIQPILLSLRLFFIPNKIVISNSWHSFLYPADISIHHGTMQGVQNFTNSRSRKSRLIAYMEKVSALFAKRILAVSENCKEELIRFYGIREAKISVLNNFVDEEHFFPQYKSVEQKVKKTILFVGSLGERKGLPFLLKFAQYLDTQSGYELRIATNDKKKSNLFSDFKNTNICTGLTLADIPAFYSGGDVLLYPTLYEGFSMATLEALSCGLPVIGTRFAIAKELQDFPFCDIFDIYDEDYHSLVSRIDNLISAYAQKRDEIHTVVAERFGKEIYKKTLLCYVDLINTN